MNKTPFKVGQKVWTITDLVPSIFHDEPVWPDPKPPKPKFKSGDLIMVRGIKHNWAARYFSEMHGYYYICFRNGLEPSDVAETMYWEEALSLEDFAIKFFKSFKDLSNLTGKV